MMNNAKLALRMMIWGTVPLLACWSLSSPTRALAQGTLGQNGVCSSSTLCGTTVGTSAFVDAFVVSTTLRSPTFCSVLSYILNPLNSLMTSTGGVIDARGLNSLNISMTCTASPWAGISAPPPSTILLPAGTIVTTKSWILPPSTHLIGEGDNISSGTTIQAKKSGFSGSNVIGFGLTSLCTPTCSGISVENLNLDVSS